MIAQSFAHASEVSSVSDIRLLCHLAGGLQRHSPPQRVRSPWASGAGGIASSILLVQGRVSLSPGAVTYPGSCA